MKAETIAALRERAIADVDQARSDTAHGEPVTVDDLDEIERVYAPDVGALHPDERAAWRRHARAALEQP